MSNRTVVYDIEQLRNFHSITAYDIVTKEIFTFVIHPSRNDLVEYMNFLSTCKTMIGYNNLNYDYPLLHYIMRNYFKWLIGKTSPLNICKELAEESDRIIASNYSEIESKYVKIKQLDLYRIYHYDNKNKRVSLKQLQFVLKWKNLQDMPFSHLHYVTTDEIEDILAYNLNDVMSTFEFLKQDKSKLAIDLRQKMSKEYNINLLNANNPKIASEIFLSILSKEMKIPTNELAAKRTYRKTINLGHCISPSISFKSDCFNALLTFLKSQVISNTKGFFSDIPLSSLGILSKYVNKPTINKKKIVENLNVLYHGIQIDYGLGGLHASVKPGIYESNDEYEIIDVDVSSFYPNIGVVNRYYPEHLSDTFCDIYSKLYYDRLKIPKSNPLNGGYKLMLNGTYGKSNDQYSFFYDPMYTMKITLNGQLYISLLAEDIVEAVGKNNISILQMNTDGITFRVAKARRQEFDDACKNWEAKTQFVLEYAYYSKMVIRDVNNYIAIYTDPKEKAKCKGCFDTDPEYHKDHSMLIVPKALLAYYKDGIPVEQTIKECNDIYSFYMYKKVDKNWTMNLIYVNSTKQVKKKQLQKVNRFYISNKGGSLVKINKEDNRKSAVWKGFKVSIANQHIDKQDIKDYDIHYNFYISECKKIINAIVNPTFNQQTLF